MSRSVVFAPFGGPEVLSVVEVGLPVPGPGQVRVRVKTAGVQPFDARYRAGAFADFVPRTFPRHSGTNSPE